jgi:hypothetical protein
MRRLIQESISGLKFNKFKKYCESTLIGHPHMISMTDVSRYDYELHVIFTDPKLTQDWAHNPNWDLVIVQATAYILPTSEIYDKVFDENISLDDRFRNKPPSQAWFKWVSTKLIQIFEDEMEKFGLGLHPQSKINIKIYKNK